MPIVPEGFDWDLEAGGSRFALRPALGLPVREDEWPADGASIEKWSEIVEHNYGPWLLEEDPELGIPTLLQGGMGRGAEGVMPVVEWLLEPAAKGVVSLIAAAAAKRVWAKVRSGGDEPGPEPEQPRVLVNRGTAVLLAADAVREEFGEESDLLLEAAEEPSAIAGHPTPELNYVGIEPWIVLLRSHDGLRRFIVVVDPHGGILGSMKTPMGEWEQHYFDLA
jgi:hypothetical protein